jgi:hypothetical protein
MDTQRSHLALAIQPPNWRNIGAVSMTVTPFRRLGTGESGFSWYKCHKGSPLPPLRFVHAA